MSVLCLTSLSPVLFIVANVGAQPWQPAATASFEAIASAEDGSLLLVRYPGDILRSTDTGGTWQVVWRGGFRVQGIGYSADGVELIAYRDSADAIVSTDSGRSWRTEPPPSPLLLRSAPQEGEYVLNDSLYPIPHCLYPLPQGTNAIGFADSVWWAVGEPGLICRWGGTGWREVKRAPFGEQPPPTPLLEKEGEATTPQPPPISLRSQEGEPHIAFSSAAHGAITVGNEIYVTNDSAVTWSRTIVPDSSSIWAIDLLSDSTSLFGMQDGRMYYDASGVLVRIDSILNPSPYEGEGQGRGSSSYGQGWETLPLHNTRAILQMCWKDRLDGNLFALTDSMLYSFRSDLSYATSYPLPLAAGEHAVSVTFPDDYTGYLLTDSTRTLDTIGTNGEDTIETFETCKIFRSLDGGSTWQLVLKNTPGLRG